MASFRLLAAFFLFLPFSLTALAAPRALPLNNIVYQTLLQNFESEMSSFDAFQTNVGLAPEVKTYLDSWKAWLANGAQGVAPTLDYQGRHWDFNLTSSEGSAAAVSLPETVDELHLPIAIKSDNSSMNNVEGYVRERVGEAAFDLIQKKRVDPVVYGGTYQSWKKVLLQPGEVALSIPSPYEDWAIKKVLVISSGEETIPKLIYLIPPIRQYVFHHLAMFQIANAAHPAAYLNSIDRLSYKRSFKADFDKIPESLKNRMKDSWVVLGYQSVFEEQLKDKLVSSLDIGSLHLKVYALSNGKAVFSIGSDATLWGEGTSFFVEPFLKMKPAGVLFFGSAGYLVRDLKVYDIHSPENFRLDDFEKLDVSIDDDFTKESGVHLSTFSPLAETKERVQAWINKGIKSVDVEQSLLANLVSASNVARHTNIHFGAINLITDFPASESYPADPHFSLDHADQSLKTIAKLKIVNDAIGYMNEDEAHFCESAMGQ